MDDLAQFLCDRLDEDEKIARATVPGPWEWTDGADTWGQCGPTLVHEPGTEETEVLAGWGHDAWGMNVADGAAAHIARHHPARVLAEVDAKRRIIKKYELALENRRAHPDDLASAGAMLALHGVVKVLALPYADHLGYREEWRP